MKVADDRHRGSLRLPCDVELRGDELADHKGTCAPPSTDAVM